ncbi:MAG: signal peptidase II [Alphaproteobacteria bacterium]|nr:MAG: signal peptidase II [Alphaproteobacteria bacterium]
MDEQEQTTANSTKKQIRNRIIWFSISIDVLILDQLSKWAIMEQVMRPKLQAGNSLNILEWYTNMPSMLPYTYTEITSFFNLVMAWNTGVSFSMFSGNSAYMPYILLVVALGITVMFATWLWNAANHLYGISYALIIGGALGNIMDRSRFGAVIDFLDFHVFGYHWPAFNIADMSVVIGISVLIIVSLFFDIKAKRLYPKHRKSKDDDHQNKAP